MANLAGNNHLSSHFFLHRPPPSHLLTESVRSVSVGKSVFSLADKKIKIKVIYQRVYIIGKYNNNVPIKYSSENKIATTFYGYFLFKQGEKHVLT